MSQNWVPPDIASICPESVAPLTQCSQIGFMYLSLLAQLFGGSVDSFNPYYQSAVNFGSVGPTQFQPTQPPLGPVSHGPIGPTQFQPNQPPLGPVSIGAMSHGPIGLTQFQPTQPPFGPVSHGPIGPTQFQSNQPPLGPVPYTPVLPRPVTVGQVTHGPFRPQSFSQLAPTGFQPFSIGATGLDSVLQTDFSINHNTKTQSHGPKGSHGFSESSFYLKSDPFLKTKSNVEFEFETNTRNPFDYNLINKRSFDTEASESITDTFESKKTKKIVFEPKNKSENRSRRKKNVRKKRQAVEEFDFIIVGAGSAGCVVANRLSEVKKWKVLLIEAGPEEPDITSVPALAPALARSSIDWMYRTQPEELTCRAQRGQTCAWISGKVMGGSSAVNFLVYMRGNKRDYDDWADLGNHGWSYREVLPYFKKSENNNDMEAKDTKYHGTDGFLNVERYDYQDKNVGILVNAFHETGLPFIDFNGEKQIGTMTVQNTSKNGKRHSTNVAFVRPIRHKRKNLVIVTKAQVSRILIHKKKKIAYGVKYFRHGVWHEVHAKKEIILSAGALGSPKILMLSGIGPKNDLEPLKIHVIKDLNVGRNLQDHATTDAMLMKLTNKTSTMIPGNQILNEVMKYSKAKHKYGPLAATGVLQLTAFIRTEFADEDKTVPDIQFHFDGRNYKEFYLDPTTYLATNKLPFSYYDSINVRPILLLPKSRGYITLNTTDPIFGLPMIFPRFFTVKDDLNSLVAALRFAVKLEDTEAFKFNGVEFIKEPVKACADHKWGTNDYFACLFTKYTTTIFHPSGTCKMGPDNDVNAVVNPRLKVHGIKHLRVADASIMPNIVRGNTNAPVIMIGEKVSDMVKEDWKYFL